jgi:hypothetical protein
MADPRVIRLGVIALVIVIGTQLWLVDAEDPAEPYLAKARRAIANGQYDAAENAFTSGLKSVSHHPRLRLAWAEFLRDDRHDNDRAEAEFAAFAGDREFPHPLQLVAWREAGEIAWVRRDRATAAADFANAQNADRDAWVMAAWLKGCGGDASAWAMAPKDTGTDGKPLPDTAVVCLWTAAQVAAAHPEQARAGLHRAAVALAAEEAAAAGPPDDDAKPPTETDPGLAQNPFVRYLAARVVAALHDDDAAAAKALDIAGRSNRALPLTQADAQGDPAFANPGPLLQKAIATLPKK